MGGNKEVNLVPDCSEASLLKISLWGSFSIYSADGHDLTPTLMKSQALIALLATARNGVRTRSWLMARLWSDRSKEQASGSLRQALAAVRKLLGQSSDVLEATRLQVKLNLDRITIFPRVENEEFLSGIDAKDQEFEDWLRQERTNRQNEASPIPTFGAQVPLQSPLIAAQQPALPVIVLKDDANTNPAVNAVSAFLLDSVARSLRENFAIRTYIEKAPEGTQGILQVRLTGSVGTHRQLFFTAICAHQGSNELLWSGHQKVELAGAVPTEDIDLLAWINEIVASIAENLCRKVQGSPDARDANHIGLLALRELFSLQPHRTEEADKLLAQAYDLDPRAIFLAWRAQLRAIQLVERHRTDSEALTEEGIAMARLALESEPGNSSVLAATSNVRLILEQDTFASEELSRQSIAQNPGNPLAWWARSFNYLYTDRPEKALQASERGHQLSRGSPYRFWWEMQTALSACAANKSDRAIFAAERCLVFAPDSRPAMRYLIGLHAKNGSVERATHWAQKLYGIEADFHPERLIKDNGYPASLLRKYEVVSNEDLAPVSAHF